MTRSSDSSVSAALLPIWVEASILPSVKARTPSDIAIEWKPLPLAPDLWMDQLGKNLPEGFARVILPGHWAPEPGSPSPRPGSRIGFWDGEVDQPLPLGCSWFPAGATLFALSAMLREFVLGIEPGVFSLLPPQCKVFTDRVATTEALGRKLDAALAFLADQKVGLGIRSQEARLGVSALFALAFGGGTRGALQGRAPVFQAGGRAGYAAFSLRWKMQEPEPEAWLNPHRHLAIAASQSDGLWLRVIPEAMEIEALLLYAAFGETGHSTRALALGTDVIDAARLSGDAAPVVKERLKGITLESAARLPGRAEGGGLAPAAAVAASATAPAEAVALREQLAAAKKKETELVTMMSKLVEEIKRLRGAKAS